MTSLISKIPSKSLTRLSFLATATSPLYRSLSTTIAEPQTQKLERIADELLSLNKLEKYDFSVLIRYKMGFHKYGPAVTDLGSLSPDSAEGAGSDKASEKVVFDVKLEKFDAAAKIKIIKEVRAFTDLGLKEAKDLVEKAPIVVKKGISKEEGESIITKLKDLGATVVLEWFSVLYLINF